MSAGRTEATLDGARTFAPPPPAGAPGAPATENYHRGYLPPVTVKVLGLEFVHSA